MSHGWQYNERMPTHAADRTHTQRHRAGSRRNKRRPVARHTYRSDIYSGTDTIGDWGVKPNHTARTARLIDGFPITAEQHNKLARLIRGLVRRGR